jgi:hypothetical protein
MSANKDRKAKIRKLKAEGAKAFSEGKSLSDVPKSYCSVTEVGHWITGFISVRNKSIDNQDDLQYSDSLMS